MNNIFPKDAQEMIRSEGVSVIDVRTPEEFNNGHIPNAQNINFNDTSFAEKVGVLDKNTKYLLNCQMGGRSSRAMSLMHELGFRDTMNLEGGIDAWRKAGLPTEK